MGDARMRRGTTIEGDAGRHAGDAARRPGKRSARPAPQRTLRPSALAALLTAATVCAPLHGKDKARDHFDVAPAADLALPAGDALVPGSESFFDTIALRIPAGERAQFVAGDNLAGYYEGYTHAFSGGSGYRVRETSLLAGHASFVDDRLLDRERAAREARVLPWGHQTDYAQASESLLLHSGRSAVSLRVASAIPATLAVMPLWSRKLPDQRVTRYPDAIVLQPHTPCPAAVPCVVAITADQPFRLRLPDQSGYPANGRLDVDAAHRAPLIVAAEPATRLTAHLAFAATADAALALARDLSAQDSWNHARTKAYERLTRSHLWTPDADYNRALVWAKASAWSFVVQEFGTGIWAGLPWFRDNWGRDTFIALPGTLLVAGLFDEAKAVLDNFARYQNRAAPIADNRDYGRVPNRVSANGPILYNTVDGTPWMIREALETARYTGDADHAKALLPLVRAYVDGVRAHWLDEDGLLAHDDADTWMDARIEGNLPWSARGNRAVEIQTLWHTALQAGAELARLANDEAAANEYAALAAKTQGSFLARFWNGEAMADRLRADGSRDLKVRPNQLMLLSVPFAPLAPAVVEARVLRNAISTLLFPHGIASLDPAHPYFHPRHESALHHKDAAYHNGTVWGWNAGFAVTSLTRYGQHELAWRLAKNLADQILHLGTRGSMSELLDALPRADGLPHPSGTYAQSWSVAEFARNAYQDFLGFRPNLLADTLAFVPALPSDWTNVAARLPFGSGESLDLQIIRESDLTRWRFAALAGKPRQVAMDLLTPEGSRERVQFRLADCPRELVWDGRRARLDGRPLSTDTVLASQAAVIGTLRFATPPSDAHDTFPMRREADALRRIIETETFE